MRANIEDLLETVGRYTAVPADVITILVTLLPIFWRILASIDLLPSIEFTTTKVDTPLGMTNVPLDAFTYVLIIYSFIATFFKFKGRLRIACRTTSLNSLHIVTKNICYISACVPAILGVMLSISFISFGVFFVSDGLAVISISAILTFVFLRNWNAERCHAYRYLPPPRWHQSRDSVNLRNILYCNYTFQDGGLIFVTWVPLVWLCLQFAVNSQWHVNIGWAFFYSSIGYLISILIPMLLIAYFDRAFNWRKYKTIEEEENYYERHGGWRKRYVKKNVKSGYWGSIEFAEDKLVFIVVSVLVFIVLYIFLGKFIISFISIVFLPLWLVWTIWLILPIVIIAFIFLIVNRRENVG